MENSQFPFGDHKGRLPAWLTAKMADVAAVRGANVRGYIGSKRLSLLKFTRPEKWVDLSHRSECGVCTRGFSLVRKRHNCRSCGLSMTSSMEGSPPQESKMLKGERNTIGVSHPFTPHSTQGGSGRNTVSVSNPSDGDPSKMPPRVVLKEFTDQEATAARDTVTLLHSDVWGESELLRTTISSIGRSRGAVLDLGIGKYNTPNIPRSSSDQVHDRKNNATSVLRPIQAASVSVESPDLSQITRLSIGLTAPAAAAAAAVPAPALSNTELNMMSVMDKISADLEKIGQGLISVKEVTNETTSRMNSIAEPPATPPQLKKKPEELVVLQEPNGKPRSNEPQESEEPKEPEEPKQSEELEEPGSFSSFLQDSNFEGQVDDVDLPQGWKSIVSCTTGKVYFYNEACGTTQWTRPDEDGEKATEAEAYAIL